jgi:hypothetical protein
MQLSMQARGGFMKQNQPVLFMTLFLFAVAPLAASDVIFYGGVQKPGKLSYSSVTQIPNDLLKGDFGGTMGMRFSAGRRFGFEQNISYSPRFAKPGVKAFQMDSNLILQGKGRIAPYATAGIGFVKAWGQEFPTTLDVKKIAAFAFSFGNNFAINYGGGLKLRKLLGPLGLNVDVRAYTLPNAAQGNLYLIQTSAGAVISW